MVFVTVSQLVQSTVGDTSPHRALLAGAYQRRMRRWVDAVRSKRLNGADRSREDNEVPSRQQSARRAS